MARDITRQLRPHLLLWDVLHGAQTDMETDMATHRIALRTSARKAGDTDIVETKDARGHWAIHGSRGSWTVTHIPTGAAGHRAKRLRDAQRWMRGAASVHVPAPEGGWVFGQHPSEEALARLAACNEAGLLAIEGKTKTKTKASPKRNDPEAVPHLCAHRGAVARAIFCGKCGSILDCRRSVSIDSTVLCSKCADKVAEQVGRPWPALTACITDGRAFDADTWALADMMYGG